MSKRYGFICVDRDDDGTGALRRYRKNPSLVPGCHRQPRSPVMRARCERRRCEKRGDMRDMRSPAIRPVQDAAQTAVFDVSIAALP